MGGVLWGVREMEEVEEGVRGDGVGTTGVVIKGVIIGTILQVSPTASPSSSGGGKPERDGRGGARRETFLLHYLFKQIHRVFLGMENVHTFPEHKKLNKIR